MTRAVVPLAYLALSLIVARYMVSRGLQENEKDDSMMVGMATLFLVLFWPFLAATYWFGRLVRRTLR